jgi:predicted nucleic acid-binding protein
LIAPELLGAEVLAVIRRAFLQGRIDAERGGEALEDLGAWKIRRIPNVSLVHTAWRYRENVSAYDALYLAAADRFAAPLITADGPLSRAPVAGILIENVRLR